MMSFVKIIGKWALLGILYIVYINMHINEYFLILYWTLLHIYQRICDQYDGPWWTIHEIWINCMNHSLQQDCVKAYNMNSFIWNIFFYTMILDLQILLLYMLNILFILIFHLILSPWKLRFWFSIPKWMPQVNIHTHICVYTFNICIQIYIYMYRERETFPGLQSADKKLWPWPILFSWFV